MARMSGLQQPPLVTRPGRSTLSRGAMLASAFAATLFAAAGFLLMARGESSPAGEPNGPAGEAPVAAAKNETSAAAADERPSPPPQAEDALPPPAHPFPNRSPAPSLEGGSGWLNASGEITLRDLRGKIVLLDFWTYCCINCIHVLPDLKYLEEKYPNELVVIGVHSAKFDNEKESDNIRRAIQRYEIKHPVINDAEMTVWRKFGARAWPTMVVVDAEGHYCGYISGEGNRELLDAVVSRLIEYHKSRGTLDSTPVRFDLELDKLPETPLRFPGKVLADEESNRLFISDSNHNRIVIASLDGGLLEVIGTGAIGANDGGYDEATFDHPQGMALVGDRLFVADTENHLIRQVDLTKKTVTTLAGTGEQARRRVARGERLETALNSPWDLVHVDGVLYIAMAGPHQIWRHELGGNSLEVHAGSGQEDIQDGPLLEAALAQPSGLATDGEFIYVCDSEGSAIRKVAIDPDGSVETVVGPSDLPFGRSLFEFGDTDGAAGRVRLQHPLGIALRKGTLYIADSYNHKIKRVDLKSSRAQSWLGTGDPGDPLDPPQFSEPAGLAIARDKLFIADTNNHRICTADLETGKVELFPIAELRPPALPESGASQVSKPPSIELPQQTVAAGTELRIEITPKLPRGYKLNPLFPHTFRLMADNEQSLVGAEHIGERQKAEIDGEALSISVPLAEERGEATFELAVTFGYCREGTGGLCKIHTEQWKLPVAVAAEGQTSIRLAPEPQ
jgi:thiol-disulfide isomerase/thioredoxin